MQQSTERNNYSAYGITEDKKIWEDKYSRL